MEHAVSGYERSGLWGWGLDSILRNFTKVGNLYLKDKERE